jgi:hypothetical protein
MPQTTGRLLAPFLVFGFVTVLPLGCRKTTELPAPTPAASAGPAEIELSDAKVTRSDPQTVQCEVKYRFTQGQPEFHDSYDLEIEFPGTTNAGHKLMHGWELKKEGTIKDSFTLSKPGAKSFELYVAETATLERPAHKKISNVVRGAIE